MRALDRKVVRDLWRLRGQVLAIAMVIASGVAVIIMALSTQTALVDTAEAYYERQAFGDVFAGLKRAPEHVADRIATIPGVQTVQTRIVRFATLDVQRFPEPVIGKFVSIPERRAPVLNQLVLRKGRSVVPNRPDEVVLSEPFAEAHELDVGGELGATLNGHRRRLRVVGIALCPEYTYSLGPGALMPDDLRFGVVWMGREALAAAFDLQGAFNDISLRLNREADAKAVIPPLDRILERYGGVGAIARADQMSNWWVQNEIAQQETMAKILPTIFLAVSAFLTNMVLSRLIATERTQIGLMKAFGYTSLDVAWHYAKLVLAITCLGVVLGLIAGAWTGRLQTEIYAESFRFPLLLYRPSTSAFVIAASVSAAAGLVGTMGTVCRAARLPPAQAMVPPSPPAFRKNEFSRTRFGRWLDQPTRIVLRHVARKPVRSLATSGGIACSVGLMIVALQWDDSLSYMAERFFYDAQRQHLTIGLAEAQGMEVVHEFEHMPAVLAVEPSRMVGVDFEAGALTHRGGLSGIASDSQLQPIFDNRRNAVVKVPAEGVVLSTRLAEKLRVGIGDRIWVKVLEGRRPHVQLPIVDLIETYIGMPAYIHIEALNRLLGDPPSLQYVNLLADPLEQPQLYTELKLLPEVSSVMLRQAAIDTFDETLAEQLLIFTTIFSLFAFALGVGVAYNAARIGLSERGRDLATLRVLGFTRGEVSYILLGELALLVVLGLPLGCYCGLGLSRFMASAFNTELFRVPLVIEPATYGKAVLIALIATVLSAAIVRRRLDRLNLIEVLKTRE